MERPTFSQSWSRVSRLTPTLRPHVQIHRQLYRGEPWHVVHDPVSNNFFRLNPVAYYLVGLLDGRRSIDEVWRLTLDKHGDAAPTQPEVIGLLGQLNQSNLLRVDMPPDAEPLLERQQRRRFKHWGGQAMSILFMRIPVWNPDRMLTWLLPLFKPILSTLGLAIWAVWMVFWLSTFLPEVGQFVRDADSVLAPTNWGWMVVLFIVTKAIHELGHGLVCKRLGGVVPAVGIMLLVLFPMPYVDATSSWNFTSKWKRLLVAAAGMIFELAIAGIGAMVWLHSEPETLARQLSYNVVFLASVTTVLFNANPLLRFDGYYILSDLWEIPNLYERATRQLKYLFQRYAFGVENVQPASTNTGERAALPFYGVSALIYRVFILTGIILFVSGRMMELGIALAAWSLFAWGVVPLGKFIHWLATSPTLIEHRARAVIVTLAIVVSLIVGLGMIPASDHRRTQGVIESGTRSDIAMQSDGFVRQVQVESGHSVSKGQIILRAENPDLEARKLELEAQLIELRTRRHQGLVEDRVAMQMAEAQIQAVQEELRRIQTRLDKLVVRSPQDGTVVGGFLEQLEGRFIRRGEVIAKVVDLDDLRVTALISQAHSASPFLYRINRVELRTAGNPTKPVAASLANAFPSGRTELPHPALGYGGGGQIATAPDDPEGQQALRPQFEIWLRPENGEPGNDLSGDQPFRALPGQRVHVRFTLDVKRPLMVQWIHRLRQILRDRLHG